MMCFPKHVIGRLRYFALKSEVRSLPYKDFVVIAGRDNDMVERENTIILLVEDSPKDRSIIKDVLTGIGYSRIYDLPSGEQAVDVVDVLPVHLIVMDTEMNPHIPNSIRGYEACMRMRQGPKGKNVAIIGMSNNGYKEEWLKAGADMFLNKFDVFNGGYLLDSKIQTSLGKYGLADARKQDVTA